MLAVCTTPRFEMADSNEPKKRAGRPVKKKRGKPKAQNVPGEEKQKSVREKGRKRKNYLTKKGVCGGFLSLGIGIGLGLGGCMIYHSNPHLIF